MRQLMNSTPTMRAPRLALINRKAQLPTPAIGASFSTGIPGAKGEIGKSPMKKAGSTRGEASCRVVRGEEVDTVARDSGLVVVLAL